jgi:hypothetical protein
MTGPRPVLRPRVRECRAGPSGVPPGSLRASPCVFRRRSGGQVQAGKDYQRLLPGRQGSSDAGREVGQLAAMPSRAAGNSGVAWQLGRPSMP